MHHINNFIDKIKFFESKNSRDFIIPLQEAKNLHTDITKLLLRLNQLEENKVKVAENPIESVHLNGGAW